MRVEQFSKFLTGALTLNNLRADANSLRSVFSIDSDCNRRNLESFLRLLLLVKMLAWYKFTYTAVSIDVVLVLISCAHYFTIYS
jgi:hypothetical protein